MRSRNISIGFEIKDPGVLNSLHREPIRLKVFGPHITTAAAGILMHDHVSRLDSFAVDKVIGPDRRSKQEAKQ